MSAPLDLDRRLGGSLTSSDALVVDTASKTYYTLFSDFIAWMQTQYAGSVFSAAGIKFPATQVPSGDSNTLDDYEEGTFTPVLEFGGGSTGITYARQAGYYTKVGNRVIINMELQISAKGSSTGDATITGIPFVASSATYNQNVLSTRLQNITFSGVYNGEIFVANDYISLLDTATTGTATNINDTNFTASGRVRANGAYLA